MTQQTALPKRLPLTAVRVESRWMRIHAQASDPLWFGPVTGSRPVHRFDDPAGQFRVCYLGTTLEVCFAETFLRNPPVRILALHDLAARSIATVEVRRNLRLVPVHGSSLARLGVTAELAAGSDYMGSQLWSRALWEHKDQPDGILYRSRHDDSALCVAVYDRAKESLAIVRDDSLSEDPQLLSRLLGRYGLGLTN
jgi:RES domain-containing protein